MLFLLILILFLLILFIPITIKIYFKRNKSETKFKLDVCIFYGHPALCIKIPYLPQLMMKLPGQIVIQIRNKLLKFIQQYIHPEKDVQKKYDNKKSLNIYENLINYKSLNIIISTLSLHCEKLNLNLQYGLNKAAITASLYGFIYSFLGCLMSFMDYKICDFKNKPEINIKPVFNTNSFSIKFEGIFSMFPVKIIYTLIKLIFYHLRRRYNARRSN